MGKKGEALCLQLAELLLDYEYVSVIKKRVAVNALLSPQMDSERAY